MTNRMQPILNGTAQLNLDALREAYQHGKKRLEGQKNILGMVDHRFTAKSYGDAWDKASHFYEGSDKVFNYDTTGQQVKEALVSYFVANTIGSPDSNWVKPSLGSSKEDNMPMNTERLERRGEFMLNYVASMKFLPALSGFVADYLMHGTGLFRSFFDKSAKKLRLKHVSLYRGFGELSEFEGLYTFFQTYKATAFELESHFGMDYKRLFPLEGDAQKFASEGMFEVVEFEIPARSPYVKGVKERDEKGFVRGFFIYDKGSKMNKHELLMLGDVTEHKKLTYRHQRLFVRGDEYFYGYGYGFMGLPLVHALNAIKRDYLALSRKAAWPALQVMDPNAVRGKSINPGDQIVSSAELGEGIEVVKRIDEGVNPPVAYDAYAMEKAELRLLFKEDKMGINKNARMATPEVQQKIIENNSAMFSTVIPFFDEFLTGLMSDIDEILVREGVYPDECLFPGETGDNIKVKKIKFNSPLLTTDSQRKILDFLRAIEAAQPVMQIQPAAKLALDDYKALEVIFNNSAGANAILVDFQTYMRKKAQYARDQKALNDQAAGGGGLMGTDAIAGSGT